MNLRRWTRNAKTSRNPDYLYNQKMPMSFKLVTYRTFSGNKMENDNYNLMCRIHLFVFMLISGLSFVWTQRNEVCHLSFGKSHSCYPQGKLSYILMLNQAIHSYLIKLLYIWINSLNLSVWYSGLMTAVI